MEFRGEEQLTKRLGAEDLGLWFTGPNIGMAEIAKMIGYRVAILDVEHGIFDLAALDSFIPFLKALGFEVFVKTLGPTREAVQQALDFGADAVVIPHVNSVAEAQRVCGYAKLPPLGDRSLAGGRTTQFAYPADEWIDLQNVNTRCYPIIEDAQALEEIDAILALPVVDGVFIGPTDLSIRRNRGIYKKQPGDWEDITTIVTAAKSAGKPWIFPAWSPEEKAFACQHGADRIFVAMEQFALAAGLRQLWDSSVKLLHEQG